MAELRWNSMLGEWVIVTPQRASRPFQDNEHQCPFCPGQEETAGDWSVLTLDNKFASLQPDEYPVLMESDLVIGTSAHGYCKVIIESPDHEMQLEMMSTEQLSLVFNEFLRVYGELQTKPGIEYILEFENRGRSIGVSLDHPHAQVYALPFVPPRIQREIEQFKRYKKESGVCLVCDAIENECKTRERVIKETEHFISLIPYGARLPYEVHVYPKDHVQTLSGIRDKLEEFGLIIADTIKRFSRVFDETAYAMVFHTSPVNGNHEYWHFHVEFYPPWRDRSRMKYLAGVESGAWTYTNDASPEEKAKELREVL